MARTKQKKIKEVLSLPNVFDVSDGKLEIVLRDYCNNCNPFTLEIGCGHGDYTIELGKLYPDRNFIGIDMRGARVYTAAERALELNLTNVAFLWGKAEKLDAIFTKDSIEEIFIPFPDPHIKRKSIPLRLITPDFLIVYKSILTKNGKVHLKTDNEEYHRFAIKSLIENNCTIHSATSNLYEEKKGEQFEEIKTRYEEHYLREGRAIKYICFGF
jgi:tRNA (guanine-N7-)-methyltransferase